ncbi:CDP-alcohol phosphatidyltransferase family protein [Gynuella sunshinyii]|uniref:Phosphatidylserine synthase n=1 Tax=Gynuella sunshinyii YC6258 TaxID=1445510 RepID=A0A0C5VSI5_9GAMM|nr:CDP-alcohol phosphatidyltransferase family protein [Gynuella sunshinyii]AJQ97181.1 phosphatidylserine synthase [Gynuella sunshinyii YC6258]
MRLIGIYNAPAWVTMLGLSSAVCSCFLALTGHHAFALTALIWAGIFDLFDGMVARKCRPTMEQSRLGMHLDSIVDVISFGITPAIIVTSLHTTGWSLVIAVFYVCAAAQRLTYFNVMQEDSPQPLQFYLGLPVTFAALIFGVGLAFMRFLPDAMNIYYANGLLLITGLLFITPFKMPKPKGTVYLFMPTLAVLFTGFWIWQGIYGGNHFV